MCKVKEKDKCRMCTAVFGICLATSIVLIVAGFLMPPTGVIDGSVLKAVGELIAFPTLAFGYRAIELGYDMKATHGDTTIEINN